MDAVQPVVPVAELNGPPLLDHCTMETSVSSEELPASAIGVELVTISAPPLVVIVTTGSVLSRIMVVLAVTVLPAASVARIWRKFEPADIGTDATDQAVVPDA